MREGESDIGIEGNAERGDGVREREQERERERERREGERGER